MIKKNKLVKRLFTILISVALITCLISLHASDTFAAEQSVIRVKLSAGSVTTFSFSLCGNYGIKGNTAVKLSSGSYSVKAADGTLKLYSGSAVLFSGNDITVEEYAPSAGAYNYVTLSTTKYGSNKYRGNLQFKLNSGKIDVINHIYLEYYLYGVVPHEMSNAWPLEALKTQAVAARTYAKRYMTGSGSYDVVDTSTHQVYKGFNPANDNAIRAVDETAKTVLKCGSELVQTYYAASNGGYVDIPQHLWSASAKVMPYHVIQPDPYDTQNTWSLQEVLIFPKSMEGSAIQYQYTDSGSMVTQNGPEAANAERYLKMTALSAVAAKGYIAAVTDDLQIVGINSMKAHTREGQHGSVKDYNETNTCPVYTKADVSMTVLANRNATMEEMELSGEPYVEEQVTVSFTIDMHKFDEQGGLYQAFNNSSLRIFIVEETQNDWRLYHRRYGHGVGMSQRGAQTRAKAGQTYQQILTFYYPNTYFEALNISPPALNVPPSAANASVINCKTAVNVRSTPDTSKPSTGSVPLGARLTVTQPFATSEWHKISFGGGDAYIYAYYVKLDVAAPTVSPTVAPSASPTATATPTATPVPTATPTPAPTTAPTATAAPTVTPAPTATPVPTATPTPAPTTAPEIVRTGTVTSSTLNIRSAPNTSGSKLGALVKGNSVSIIEVEPVKDWHKIWYNNIVAYVWADYVQLSSASTLPAVKAKGVVTSSSLNVRSGPGTSYSKTGVLTKGSKVDITKTNYSPDWHQIIYNGKLAYAHKSYISILSGGSGGTGAPSGAVYASVNADKLNFRAAANTSSKVYASLSRGTIIQVIQKGSTWHKVKYGGREGYMYASHLKVLSAVYGKVAISSLNVRSGPSSSTAALGKLSSGTTVEILELGSSWHKIKYGSGAAYVYASHIKLQ